MQTNNPKLETKMFLQVHKAFAYLSKEDTSLPDVRYEVKARRSNSMTSQRGILIREPMDSLKPVTYVCDVQPKLHEVRLKEVQCVSTSTKHA